MDYQMLDTIAAPATAAGAAGIAVIRVSGSRAFAPEVDALMRQLAAGLWSRSAGVREENAEYYDSLYSRGQPKPSTLHWELTGAICAFKGFTPPAFFRAAAVSDAARGTDSSRVLLRAAVNVLLYLAAAGVGTIGVVDDDVVDADFESVD